VNGSIYKHGQIKGNQIHIKHDNTKYTSIGKPVEKLSKNR